MDSKELEAFLADYVVDGRQAKFSCPLYIVLLQEDKLYYFF